ncbi:putative transcription factor AS2-LOB family [Helianthus annuus]|uniref:Putative LOB domain-containing protein n=1 Tax=Helianthus annuus TaxID=4232 RepID=A0A251TFM4_HELAN|nr:putative transcription factor AS2-LOB family [Helianthus annuus]
MSCNGCRILRKGCGVDCVLRPCLDWIESPDAQAHATLFVSKFFGRGDLVNYISSVQYDHQRAGTFKSYTYRASVLHECGTLGLIGCILGIHVLCEWLLPVRLPTPQCMQNSQNSVSIFHALWSLGSRW